MTPLYICNTVAVGLFGIVLSAAFCNITWSRRKVLEMALFTLGIFLLQAVVYFGITPELGQYLYPLHTHLPLILILCLLSRQRLWPVISVLTAYLCCQLRRWLALLIVELCAGGDAMQQAVELALTVPLLLLLLRAAPAVRSVSQYPAPIQCQFGIIPAVYYAFDYLTRVYTNLLSSGSPTVVEFMPFVCSVAYLIFVFRLSEEQRARTYLEQMQNSLNLQVHQAVREIEAMRESQNKTRAYRHDLRHHLQYLSACLENGQYTQAQPYIRSISDEIEASRVTVYCENEAANLIFSSFAGRAAAKGIPLSIHAELPHALPLTESDLCVLLSNALENALNACRRRAEQIGESGGIEVQTYEKSGKLFLQVVNDCVDTVRFEHGIPVSNQPGHGIGVRSICAIAERYGGIYSFAVQNGRFLLRVSL